MQKKLSNLSDTTDLDLYFLKGLPLQKFYKSSDLGPFNIWCIVYINQNINLMFKGSVHFDVRS